MVSTKSSVAPELVSDDELIITEEVIVDQMVERVGVSETKGMQKKVWRTRQRSAEMEKLVFIVSVFISFIHALTLLYNPSDKNYHLFK